MGRCVRWLACVVGLLWLWVFAPVAVASAAPDLPDLVPKDGSGRYYAYTEPGDLPQLKLRDGSSLPLRETKVKAKLTGLVAEVEVRQTYVNKSKKAIEAVYVFPLPENSAVNDMKIVVGKRVVRAEIRERAAAKRVYEKAKKAGMTAALLEQERPNVFTQSVANIAPGNDIDVVVTYVQDLTYDAGTYEFVFPMVVGERYVSGTPTNWAPVGTGTAADTDKVPDASRVTPPVAAKGTRTGKDISISVIVDAGVRIRSYKVPTHDVVGGLDASGRLAVKLQKKTSLPNRDFVLRYRAAQPTVASTVFLDGDDEGGHFTLVVQPPDVNVDDLVGARELIFVVDTSGSMAGQPLAMCKVAMRRAIAAMRPLDTFNIVTFAGHTALAFDEPQPANDTNIRAATEFVDGLRGGGGTEILDAVDTVLAPDVGSGRHRYVFFMTDGYVAIEEEVGARITGWLKGHRAHGQKARVFSFGVGSSVNRELLETLARAGKGVAVYATTGDDPRRGVAKFFRYIDRAVWTDLKVDWGMTVLDLHPAEPPDLFASRAAVIHGRYKGTPSASVKLRARRGKKKVETRAKVRASTTSPKIAKTLWARARVRDLTDANAIDPNLSYAREITRLGLDHRLVTEYTSFVAVDRSRVVSGGNPARVVQTEEVRAELLNPSVARDAASSAPGGTSDAAGIALDDAPLLTSRRDEREYAESEKSVRRQGRTAGCAHCSVSGGDGPWFLVIVLAGLLRRRRRR